MSHSRGEFDRLAELLGTLCDEDASQSEIAELDALVFDDEAARRRYLRYCRMHSALTLDVRAQRATQTVFRQVRMQESLGISTDSDSRHVETPLPPISFAGDLLTPAPIATSHFASGWLVAYLVATVVFAIGLAIGALVHVSGPTQIVKPSTPLPSPSSPRTPIVARITGMVDCVLNNDRCRDSNQKSEIIDQNSPIHLGDTLALRSGLLELTYDTGARVILQGPVTYEIESPTAGYLSIGKLTARLEKGSGEYANPKRQRGTGDEDNFSGSANPLTSGFFAVRTPTALVTDLGTEFGVEVDKHGDTISHVFRGSVQVQFATADGRFGAGVRILHPNESTRVVAGAEGDSRMFAAPGPAPDRFIRTMPAKKSLVLDLADVVAGGDGFSGRRGHGIDPSCGRPTDATTKDCQQDRFPLIVGDGEYHRVEALPLVDGVFIPGDRPNGVQVDSSGHTFAEFGKTSNTTPANIWAGGTIPAAAASMPPHVASMLASQPPSTVLLPSKLGDIDYATPGRGLIFMHANNGITFDLDAIRRANPGCKLLRFRATAGNTEPVSAKGLPAGYADVWVLVDGKARFRRREINGCSGGVAIKLPIAESDRFLTLVAADGGNDMAGDWILFGDPVLDMLRPQP